MVLRYKEMSEKLDSKYFSWSCVNPKNVFTDIIARIKPIPKTIVEIGTRYGISAAILASIGKVYTFDIEYYSETEHVWNELNVKKNIHYFIVKNRKEIRKILKKIKFDFAFVDGNHTYKDVKADFELVKCCERVLLHDNFKGFPEIAKFCREIGCKKIGRFGYWEKK